MSLRQDKKDQTRAAILAAAEESFRSQGFEATRVRDVAERVPVSVQTLYNYFPSKGAILTAIVMDRYARQADAADQMTREFLEPDTGESRIDRFLHLVRWGLRALVNDREFLSLVMRHSWMLQTAAPPGASTDAFHQQLADLDRTLVHMYETLQKYGDLRDDLDARTMAELHVVVFRDRTNRWFVSESEDAEALEADAMGAIEILLRGFAPLPSQGPSS